MTTPKTPATPGCCPTASGADIDYDSLEFDPDLREKPPDHMEQNREIREMTGLFAARFTEFDTRPDVFLDDDSFICYDPSDLNVRIAPDVYLAFGVDAEAIRPRRLYLPWEVGKPPDLAVEIASESTSRTDVNRKPGIYAGIGVRELWLFDPSGGRYYGQELWGGELSGDGYRDLPATREPDGILKIYSPLLQASICWDAGWPRLYYPSERAYQRNWQAERAAAVAALDQRDAARVERDAAQVERDTVQAELEAARAEAAKLRELLRRRDESESET